MERFSTRTEGAIVPWWRAPLILFVLGIVLYLPGVRWGLPSSVSWSQDTIAAARTIGAMETWPAAWGGRYPPLHYFVLRAVYQPILEHWRTGGELSEEAGSGAMAFAAPQAPKIGLLLLVARLVTVLMAIGAAAGVYYSARLITGDEASSWVAAIALMTGPAFCYFARLGNVDVPSVCWLTWSMYFYLRLNRSGRKRDAALLGLFAALAMCTKDAVAGVYPGMAIVLLFSEWRRTDREPGALRALARTLFEPKWFVGLMCCVVPFLYINGVFHNPQGYLDRLRYWLDPAEGSLHANQLRYSNQLELLWATVRYAAGAVGWPMVVALLASVVYAARCHRRACVVLLVPAFSYYLIVIVSIGFVYCRFLFPPLVFVLILFGIGARDLWRAPRLSDLLRRGLPAAVFLLTTGYTMGLTLEMASDSRYRAEQWFRDNVPSSASIGAFPLSDKTPLRPQYLPRIHEQGYASYPVAMALESFAKPQPEYLILTNYNYEDFGKSQRECKEALLRGELGYRPVAMLAGRHLPAGASWLTLAGYGAPTPGKISPTIIVLQRNE